MGKERFLGTSGEDVGTMATSSNVLRVAVQEYRKFRSGYTGDARIGGLIHAHNRIYTRGMQRLRLRGVHSVRQQREVP
jgi:hypothetical protein